MSQIDPKDLYAYLSKIGATPNEASMLTSAAGVESAYSPTAVHDKDANGNPTGYGMWGHRLERRDAMFSAAGTSSPNWQQQAAFALSDLRSRPEAALVNHAKTPQDLTIAQEYYERPQGFSADAPQNGVGYAHRLALTQNISAGNFSDPGAPRGKTMDPNDPTNSIDPAAHQGWNSIFSQAGLQNQNLAQQAQTAKAAQGQPKLDTNGSAFGALASGAMAGGANGQTPLLSRLLFGNNAGALGTGLIPTPNNGQGLLGGLFSDGSSKAAAASPAASSSTPGFATSPMLTQSVAPAAAAQQSATASTAQAQDNPTAITSPALTAAGATPSAAGSALPGGLGNLANLFGGLTGSGGSGLAGALGSGLSSGISGLGGLLAGL